MNTDWTGFHNCKGCHKTESLWNHTTTNHKEGEQLEVGRSVVASSCNSGDRTDQWVQSLMFMMMMILLICCPVVAEIHYKRCAHNIVDHSHVSRKSALGTLYFCVVWMKLHLCLYQKILWHFRIKVNLTLEHSTKAQKGSRCIALFILQTWR